MFQRIRTSNAGISRSGVASVHAAALMIGAAGLASRLLGILRDRMLAAHFGAGRELDIYYAAFQIPDFLFTLFLLGAASAAIIPVLLEFGQDHESQARAFITELAGIFFVGSLAVVSVAFFLAPVAIRYAAPGFTGSDRALVISLTRIMLASPLFLGLSNILSSVLQARRRFFAYALAAVCYNLGIILGILFFLPRWGLPGLAAGVVLGAALHFAVQVPMFLSLGFGLYAAPSLGKKIFSFSSLLRPVRRVMALSLPRVIAISASNIADIGLVAIASTLASGSIVVFKFADNLRFVPIGLFGVSFATAAFPALSLAAVRNEAEKFSRIFFGTLRSVLFWIMPASVLVFVLRAQIVRVTLGAGRFDWGDTRLTAALLGMLTVVIIADSLSLLFVRSFYALGNTKKPFLVNSCTAMMTIVLGWAIAVAFRDPAHPVLEVLVRILHLEGVAGAAVVGVALAAVIGSVGDSVLLFLSLTREMRLRFGTGSELSFDDRRAILAICAAAFLSGVVAYGALRVATLVVTLDRLSSVFLQGAFSSFAGIIFYAGVLWLLGNREIGDIMSAVRRRIFGVRILPAGWDGERTP